MFNRGSDDIFKKMEKINVEIGKRLPLYMGLLGGIGGVTSRSESVLDAVANGIGYGLTAGLSAYVAKLYYSGKR